MFAKESNLYDSLHKTVASLLYYKEDEKNNLYAFFPVIPIMTAHWNGPSNIEHWNGPANSAGMKFVK